MFEKLGHVVLRFRFVFLAAWILLAGASLVFAPSLAEVGRSDETAFLPKEAESMAARDVATAAFPQDGSGGQATVAFSRPAGLTDADREYIAGLPDLISGPNAPAELRDVVGEVVTAEGRQEYAAALRSQDGQVEIAQVNLKAAAFELTANDAVELMRAQLASTVPDGLTANVTGRAGIGADYLDAVVKGTDSTTIVTVLLVLLILLVIYRAPLAALAPLVTIGAAFLVSRGVLGILAQAGWQISSILDSFIVVLVFGVGTDYSIFLISRFREELAHDTWPGAARRAVGRIGAVIAASAATVIVGLASMASGRFGLIQTIGPALAITIFITLLAGLTLTPAYLGIFGRYLFWPLHQRFDNADARRGFWGRLAGGITRRPGIVTATLLVALVIPALALGQMRSNFDILTELPPTGDARGGFEVVSAHFDKGQLFPIQVLVTAPSRDLSNPESLALIRQAQDQLAAVPGVGNVRSVVSPEGTGETPDGFRPSKQLGDMAEQFGTEQDPEAALQALLKPDATAGIDAAASYLDALAGAFPGLADIPAHGAAMKDLAGLKTGIEQTRGMLRVSNQLQSLSDALRSPATIAGADPTAFGKALQGYLGELYEAYPEVGSEQALADAVRLLAKLSQAPDLATVGQLATALGQLADTFKDRPDAYLVTESLPATPGTGDPGTAMAEIKGRLVGELTSLAGEFSTRSDYFIPTTLAGEAGAQATALRDAYVSKDGTVTRLYVTLAEDPYGTSAIDLVPTLRSAATGAAASFGPDATVYTGGSTPEFADIQTTINGDFVRVAIITVIGILIVLMLLLRAVVAPIYLVATVLLSWAASMGLSSLIFQDLLGHSGVNYFLSLIVFVLLVAIGSDYNIFLMSRVREESEKRGVSDGIRFASARTGTVITSAGIILAGTFATLTITPLRMLFQVGLAVALGVLVDTFIVRSMLVPAITKLAGRWAWWPSRLRGVEADGGGPAAGGAPVAGDASAAGDAAAAGDHAGDG